MSAVAFTADNLSAAMKAFDGKERVTRADLARAAGLNHKQASKANQLVLALRRANLIQESGYITERNNGTLRAAYRRAT